MNKKQNNINRSLQQRDEDYKRVLRQTHNPYKATRSYVAGNKWAKENARAVGNMD